MNTHHTLTVVQPESRKNHKYYGCPIQCPTCDMYRDAISMYEYYLPVHCYNCCALMQLDKEDRTGLYDGDITEPGFRILADRYIVCDYCHVKYLRRIRTILKMNSY